MGVTGTASFGLRYRAAICWGLRRYDDLIATDAATAVGKVNFTIFFFFCHTRIFLIIARNCYALTLCCQNWHQVSPSGGCARPERRWCARKQSPPPHDSRHICDSWKRNNICDPHVFKAQRLLPSCSETQSRAPLKLEDSLRKFCVYVHLRDYSDQIKPLWFHLKSGFPIQDAGRNFSSAFRGPRVEIASAKRQCCFSFLR